MELHLVIVKLSHETKAFRFADWKDADFIAQAAKKFSLPYMWWYRVSPDKPWFVRHRYQVSSKELADETSPFGQAAVDRLGQSGAGISPISGTGKPAPVRGKPSNASGETGPGLERP